MLIHSGQSSAWTPPALVHTLAVSKLRCHLNVHSSFRPTRLTEKSKKMPSTYPLWRFTAETLHLQGAYAVAGYVTVILRRRIEIVRLALDESAVPRYRDVGDIINVGVPPVVFGCLTSVDEFNVRAQIAEPVVHAIAAPLVAGLPDGSPCGEGFPRAPS